MEFLLHISSVFTLFLNVRQLKGENSSILKSELKMICLVSNALKSSILCGLSTMMTRRQMSVPPLAQESKVFDIF